jgi:tRNA pseudouridine38-40 synthase
MNFRVTLAYDGTDFRGWQMQGGERTVQKVLTEALVRIDGARVIVHGAGRTDSGVHAEGQVASFFLQRPRPGEELRRALNGNLPPDLRVLEAAPTSDDFHARANARSKTYRYQLYTGQVMCPFLRRFFWHYPHPLDLERLAEDGEALLGRHDFSAFTVSDCDVRSRIRTLTGFRIESDGPQVLLTFAGDGFLRQMVRTIVGTLVDSNRGRLRAGSIRDLLTSRQRSLAGTPAPAKGLTMVKVEY